jgi:DNA-binding winged helix-turn-helix (wHTH) protein
MSLPTITPRIGRFGPYEIDVRSGELRKFGTRIKVGEQPLRILILLMERQGELVTREELRARLWSDHTFVDFDHGLNSAVQRLRDGLSDTAQKEQWIETCPAAAIALWARWNGAIRTAPRARQRFRPPISQRPSLPRRRQSCLGRPRQPSPDGGLCWSRPHWPYSRRCC